MAIVGCTLAAHGSSPGGPWDSPSPARAPIHRDYPREEKALERWLDENIVPGRTTQEDVVAIFGRGYRNLDRPVRDAVVTIEYPLRTIGVPSPMDSLVFDFDRQRRVVCHAHGYVSYGICGFCPHVFADDGHWRLEGKLLAGCVGADREGPDTLLLPRLAARQGRLRVKVSNLAQEVEYLDQVELGCVPLQDGEELDVDGSGRPFVWKPTRQVSAPANGTVLPLSLSSAARARVLVLEVRNTTAFETAMREHLLGGVRPAPQANLEVRFDDGGTSAVRPVGTKFLRRVVLPVPPRASAVRLHTPGRFWLMQRVWVGTGRAAEVHWRPADQATAPQPGAADLVRASDGRRLRLEPMQEAELVFAAPEPVSGFTRCGYVLRMAGYYEFLP